MKDKVSLIIVHYKATPQLISCITSIKKTKTKISHEIIVVDNDEEHPIGSTIREKFPSVIYVKAPHNLGFGTGNNLGASHASGNIFFFLNEDVAFQNNVLDNLVRFLNTHQDAGVVAPLICTADGKPFPHQGTDILTFQRGIVALSILNKAFPNNPISKEYWKPEWNKDEVREIAVVPGTAMCMRREVYAKIGGFDEHFFLYFEEHDFCKRAREAGYTNYIVPAAKLFHEWGASTTDTAKAKVHFVNSRFYYFRKHDSLFSALLIQTIASLGKYDLLLIPLLVFSAGILLFRLSDFLIFFGDIGWFYLSARNMLLTGSVPLVGIASSHPWLHQGPWWTYLLSLSFLISNFNPLSGGFLAILFGLGSIVLIYHLGKVIFSERVGFITALLMASSPLVIINARMPYHTAPIPFFTLLVLLGASLFIRGVKYGFPLAMFSLAILYNFELATSIYIIAFIFFMFYGVITKQSWAHSLKDRSVLSLSVFAALIPMLPMLLYDMQHGFPQTVGFAAWTGYKVLTIFGFPSFHPEIASASFGEIIVFFLGHLTTLLFLPSSVIAAALFLGSSVFFGITLYRGVRGSKVSKGLPNNLLLGWFFLIGFLGFFATKTTSEAYLPMLFPLILLVVGYFVSSLLQRRSFQMITCVLLFFLVTGNVYSLLQQNYLMGIPGGYGPTFTERVRAADEIVKEAGESSYTIQGAGPGSQFPSFTMNYAYLTWWLSHGPAEKGSVTFIISETSDSVTIKKISK